MSIIAVSGAAGCGKTYRLMNLLRAQLEKSPLKPHQKILALTFMHGSRIRLSDKLSKMPEVNKRFECLTIDSFALRIVNRWKGLAKHLSLPEIGDQNFDQCCDQAATLLNEDIVSNWVATSFPIMLIDEGQDLSSERLRIVDALKEVLSLFIAGDEFQCLDERLLPNPLFNWLPKHCTPEYLSVNYRTNLTPLLNAALAARNGQLIPSDNKVFKMYPAPSKNVAAAFVCNAIAWGKSSDVVILTPSTKSKYVLESIQLVTEKSNGKQNNGPYRILWEKSDEEFITEIIKGIKLDLEYSFSDVISFLTGITPRSYIIKATINAFDKAHWISGKQSFYGHEVKDILLRKAALQRQHGLSKSKGFSAMSIHQAKNREFDGVIILWPYTVGGENGHKRRILYNAITRAKKWCLILAQNKDILAAPPFSA